MGSTIKVTPIGYPQKTTVSSILKGHAMGLPKLGYTS